jgi:hypothetical protein
VSKAVGASHDAGYAELLDRIIDTTPNSKLRGYALKARNAL